MLMRRKGEVRIFDRTEALRRREWGKAGWLHWPWSIEQALCPSEFQWGRDSGEKKRLEQGSI